MMIEAAGVSHRQRLRFAISGLCTRDLEAPSVAAARAVLGEVRHNKQHLRAALLDILSGIDAAPKHAAKCRLQLAEYAVLECISYEQLTQILPRLSQQANVVLSAHRQDAGCINSLAALLTSCIAKLLLEPQGSYAAILRKAQTVDVHAPVTADFLCDALLFPVISSTYRDPEQTRVSAGSVVLLGLFEVLKSHTDQAAVIEAVRRCLSLMLQLMGAGSVAQRAPGVLQPVCSCVEVLGLSMDKEGTCRLLKLALKAAMTPHSWQVRRDACQALAVLAASLQFRMLLPLEDQPQHAEPVELVLTPALELLITQKPNVIQVLEDVRYDKIAAVRATAASAWAEFTALPDPPDAEDATPTGRADKVKASTGATTGKPSKASAKRSASSSSPSKNGRKRPAPPRFVRPQRLPGAERDFGVLVFAPPPPPEPEPEPAQAADTSQAHGSDRSPVARQLQFDAETSMRASMDAASQTIAEGTSPGQRAYTVQSPLSGSNPLFATSSSPSPGHSMEHADIQQLQHQLQQQLQQQQRQQSGLPALLASGFGGSPVRLDISHHVHGRVEISCSSAGGSPGAVQGASPGPASPANTPATGVVGSVTAGIMSAIAAAAGDAGVAEVRHSVQTIHPMWGLESQQQQAWGTASANGMTPEPSFGPSGVAAAAGAAEADQLGELQLTTNLTSMQHDQQLLQQPPEVVQPAAGAGAAVGLQYPFAADSTSPGSRASTAEQGRRQRQRWLVQQLSCSPGCDDVSEPPSRQCTPAAGTPPRSPSSLEVLRSVGDRVQLLLETLSRQTSHSSRQGSRSPVAPLPGRAVQGPPTSPGAPPIPRTARRSSSSLSSSSAASMQAGVTAAGSVEATQTPADRSCVVAARVVVQQQPQHKQQLVFLQKQLTVAEEQPVPAAVQDAKQQQLLSLQKQQPCATAAAAAGLQAEAWQGSGPGAHGAQQQEGQHTVEKPCSPAAAVQHHLQMQWSAHDLDQAVHIVDRQPEQKQQYQPADHLQQQHICDLLQDVGLPQQSPTLQVLQPQQVPALSHEQAQLLQELQGSVLGAQDQLSAGLQFTQQRPQAQPAEAVPVQQQDLPSVQQQQLDPAGTTAVGAAATLPAAGELTSMLTLQLSQEDEPVSACSSLQLTQHEAGISTATAQQPYMLPCQLPEGQPNGEDAEPHTAMSAQPSRSDLAAPGQPVVPILLTALQERQLAGVCDVPAGTELLAAEAEAAHSSPVSSSSHTTGLQLQLLQQVQPQLLQQVQPQLLQQKLPLHTAEQELQQSILEPVQVSLQGVVEQQQTSTANVQPKGLPNCGPVEAAAAATAGPVHGSGELGGMCGDSSAQICAVPPAQQGETMLLLRDASAALEILQDSLPQQQQQPMHSQVQLPQPEPEQAGNGSLQDDVQHQLLTTAGGVDEQHWHANGMQQPQAAGEALSVQEHQLLLLQQQSSSEAVQQPRSCGVHQLLPGHVAEGHTAEQAIANRTEKAATAQPPSLSGAGAAGVGTASMLYNDLFQPSADADNAESAMPALTASPVSLPAGLTSAVPAATGSAAAPAFRPVQAAQAASAMSAGASGMSRVDQALEKLQSLRSTLRSISSSGAGPSSLPLSARASLSDSRTASLQLNTRDHSSSSTLQLQAQSSSGVIQEGSTVAVAAGVSLRHVAASGNGAPGEPAAASTALASAKDWIRQISERLQQVSAPKVSAAPVVVDAHQAAELPADSLMDSAVVADPAVQQQSPHGEVTGARWGWELAADDASNTVVLPASLRAPVGTDAEASASSQGCSTAVSEVQPPEAAAALLLGSSKLCCVSSILHMQEPVPGSAGWSNRTASSGSSSDSSSTGSAQLANLMEEQLHAGHGAPQDVQDAAGGPAAAEVCSAQQVAADSSPDTAVQTGSVALEHHRQPVRSEDSSSLLLQHQQSAPSGQQQEDLDSQHQQELLAEAACSALAPQAAADMVAVGLLQSEQRMQQLLSQSDDTMLLMSFALKLDRLGRKFTPQGQSVRSQGAAEVDGGGSPVRLSAASLCDGAGSWQSPRQPCLVAGSFEGANSPAGPWTSITHNSLYNASPASTPQRPTVPQGVFYSSAAAVSGAIARDGCGDTTSSAPTDAKINAPGACTPQMAALADWGSLSVLAGPGQSVVDQQHRQDDAGCTAQLHESVLRNVMGVGLHQLQAGDPEAAHAVALALTSLEQQLQQASVNQPQAALAQDLKPHWTLLKEDLRAELRQQCVQQMLCCQALSHAGEPMPNLANLSRQEELFAALVLPLVADTVRVAAAQQL